MHLCLFIKKPQQNPKQPKQKNPPLKNPIKKNPTQQQSKPTQHPAHPPEKLPTKPELIKTFLPLFRKKEKVMLAGQILFFALDH